MPLSLATPLPDDLTARRDAAVAWLMGRINYERVAVVPYNERQLKLDRMRQLLTRLGAPDKGLRIIHVAGSKGKGSTSALIASVLTASGRRTGVYSSPHLERIEERWSIDGHPLEAEQLIGLVDRLRPVVAAIDAEAEQQNDHVGPPTFFEITTAMALVHFADQQCDAVVLEVGLGGRLDSTNVCLPVVSVITSISLDHTKQLGETLGEIAGEKAGIIKPGVPVVSGVVDEEPAQVIAQVARENGCRLLLRERDFGATVDAGHASQPTTNVGFDYWRTASGECEQLADLSLSLHGKHQIQNAAVALAVIDELADQGWAISRNARSQGLATTRLAARVEWFAPSPGVRPAIIVDTAHNEASALALAEAVLETAAGVRGAPVVGPRTLLLAVSRDKKAQAIVAALARHFDHVVTTRYLENPRAVPPEQLAQFVRSAASVRVVDTPAEAWQAARDLTPTDGLIVVTGSFFIAAEVRPLVLADSNNG